MKSISNLILSILILLSTGCSKQRQDSLQVFCAASLTEVMTAMIDSFKLENKQSIDLNFASSGTLARQIQMGAGADIFLSANMQWVDFLIEKSVLKEEHVSEIAGNSLVLISGNDAKDLDLAQAVKERFVIGDPATVPVGNYAKTALEKLSLWENAGDFIYGRDVKHVLKIVEIGEVDYGIVYKTDAISSKKVRIVSQLPDNVYNSVNYFMGNLNPNTPAVMDLFIFIQSEKGLAIWQKFGFKRV